MAWSALLGSPIRTYSSGKLSNWIQISFHFSILRGLDYRIPTQKTSNYLFASNKYPTTAPTGPSIHRVAVQTHIPNSAVAPSHGGLYSILLAVRASFIYCFTIPFPSLTFIAFIFSHTLLQLFYPDYPPSHESPCIPLRATQLETLSISS